MDIALNSFILFFLFIFPGIIFRRFYFVGEFSKQYNSNNWANTFYISLIPGLLIQFLTSFVFFRFIYNHPINLDFKVANSIYKKLKANDLPNELFDLYLLKWVLFYIITTIIISFISAQFCWKIVRYLNFDKRFSALRFDNYWHYYLSGESLKFKEFRNIIPQGKEVILTEADVLIDVGNEGTKLYKGFIRQHTICKNTGDLKAIYLTDVRRYRRDLPPNDIKVVPGHIMLIPAEKIININMTYITVSRNTVNDSRLFFILLNLLAVLFVTFYPFNLILSKTTFFGLIIGKLWILLDIFIVTTYLQSFLNTANRTPDEISKSRKGLIGLFFIVFFIIYIFFYI
jgi:hypothetical protein